MRCGRLLGTVVTLFATAVLMCACGGGTKGPVSVSGSPTPTTPPRSDLARVVRSSPPYFSRHVEIVGLKGIAFPDTSHAWVTGNVYSRNDYEISGGAILATTDGGTVWEQQESAGSWTPWSIVFAGDRCGWMLGSAIPNRPDYSVVLATSDGGATWAKQDTGTSGTADELYDIACADAKHAWAVGDAGGVDHGLILATTDGGATWRQQFSATKLNLLDVAFTDPSHGLVAGERTKGDDPFSDQFIGSIVLRTTDGGASWTK